MTTKSKFPPSVKAGKPVLSPLPSGWNRSSLSNYLDLKSRKVNLADAQEYDLVTVKRSRGGVVKRETLKGSEIKVKSQYQVKSNDFIISKRQIVHGACGLVPEHLDGSIVSNEYSVFTAKPNFELKYLQYLSESLYFQQTCFHSSIGVHIEKMIFKLDEWFSWEFNIPPLNEQKKIVEILTTWDKAINTTERLIENSKQQKKALMQQLLTGQKRLLDDSGQRFYGDWDELPLIDTVSSKRYSFTGGPFGSDLKSSDYTDEGVRIIQLQNIGDGYFKNDYKIFTSEEKADELSNCNIYPNDIIISKMGDPVARATLIPEYDARYIMASDGIRLAIDKTKYNNKFILESINSPYFRNIALSKSTGSTRKRIGLNDLKNIHIYCPSLEEQQKIAAVLTTADGEIEVLEQQLADLQQEKKALMQQLLTGKKRVSVD